MLPFFLYIQAFILPLTEVPTMRRVVKVYQEWIQVMFACSYHLLNHLLRFHGF